MKWVQIGKRFEPMIHRISKKADHDALYMNWDEKEFRECSMDFWSCRHYIC